MRLGANQSSSSPTRTPPRRPASEGRVTIPQSDPFHCRLDIPIERLAALVGSWPEPALLESGAGFGTTGRWSLFTARPRLVFEATGTTWNVRAGSSPEVGEGDVLAKLEEIVGRWCPADPAEHPERYLPPFRGGLIGFFGYDLAPRLERLPRTAAPDSRIPDIRFALYDTAVTVDHGTGAVELWA
jgi:para-aminobenzoate synthetase component I